MTALHSSPYALPPTSSGIAYAVRRLVEYGVELETEARALCQRWWPKMDPDAAETVLAYWRAEAEPGSAATTSGLKTGQLPILGCMAELEALKADGAPVPIELSITEVPLPEDRPFTGILPDVTMIPPFARRVSGGRMTEQRLVRKLAAIVVADIVGYSRLMEADESGTLSRLKVLRAELIEPKIAQYCGRIVKTTGDGWLVDFASATDALQSTIELQEAMAQRNASLDEDRRMQLRAGINLGEIIIEGDDIYGTDVNIAARLEKLAEPGGICMSSAVYDQVQSILGLRYEDMGDQTVKNIAKSIHSFSVRAGQVGKASEPQRKAARSAAAIAGRQG